jgi:hypothetical protein
MGDAYKRLGIILVVGLLVCIGWLVLVAAGNASTHYKDARTTAAAHAKVVRLANELREAQHVESATVQYSRIYGSDVGRWVWLARSVGWKWQDIPKLMYVIHRESGGSPTAKNPVSTASGLLQFLAFHWDGTGDYKWRFDPFNPRQNLLYGLRLFRLNGWTPWAV